MVCTMMLTVPFSGLLVVDRNGDPLAVLIHPQDDELAGQCLLGDHRRFDLKQNHRRLERLFSHNAIHKRLSSFFIQLFTGPSAQKGP
jgi:hypothetical protein